MKDIYLRPASLEDANVLLAWRNDTETRLASHNQDIISLEQHITWLEHSLAIPDKRQLWIAEIDGVAVGTCRADVVTDTTENVWELSWTVAPEMRGKGIAYRMLRAFITSFESSLMAQIKCENIASIKVADKLGFILKEEKEGVLFYSLPPFSKS
ncbi:GNAT family N-acetyltransferase [Marinomonas sp. C2222]|uniref:GNAT family N-acetyltransferase n=1 Tax=Marinomonas sargassi TaxID=2984494 RepID=A0ABT2YPU4_9GAMM|nr:GNAT family N-acetyltransferase [Marinomonas sargassi]MCV2401895.1 GNAT family N-acetyltransferase [Marinomonas sargassi]